MAQTTAENGALQYAADNYASAASAITTGTAGYMTKQYTAYTVWKAANAGVNPPRTSARGRIFGKFFDTGL